MMVAFLLLVAAGVAVALVEWRLGLLAMVVVAMVQDPVRKMMPGAPGLLVLSAAMVWGAAVIGAVLGRQIQWPQFRRHNPGVASAIIVFAVSLVPAAIRSSLYSAGSWQITLVGLLIYGSLLLGMLLGVFYPRTGRDIYRLLAWYCVLSALAVSGGLLEKMGYRHASIGTESMGFSWVTYRMGSDPVHMLAGFFRGPDVQGWHGSMLVMLSLVLAVYSKRWMRGLWLLTAAVGGMGVLVCGRRKMVSMLPVFLLVYLVLNIRHGRFRQLGWALAAVVLVCTLGQQVYRVVGVDEVVMRFYGTALDTARDDIQRQGVESVFGTYQQAGFFGYGLGMATQGTHHIAADRPRVWQESGPSKLMAELGVPGFVGFIILGVALLRALAVDLRRAADSSLYAVFSGLAAVVIANGAAGIVSAQIFGDPFVAAFLSLLIGIVLSSARVRYVDRDAPRETQQRGAPDQTCGSP
jgi:hypothetical protein